MGKKLVGIDKTEQEILDFMYVNYPKNCELHYLDSWIKARNGSIVAVFLEYLEVYKEQNYSTKEEEELIENFRCLTKKGKIKITNFLIEIYSEERNAKK